MWETLMALAEAYPAEAVVIGLLASCVTMGSALIGLLRYLATRKKPQKVTIANPEAIIPPEPKSIVKMSPAEYAAELKKQRDEATAERDKTHGAERKILQDRIDELSRRLAEPEEALAQQHAKILSLEALLERSSNEVGGDLIAAAKAALEKGDNSLADQIFADIENRNELAVQETARAAFGRGEIAEDEVRWHDAYTHYKRAADLSDDLDHLHAYARMTWRLAKGDEAVTAFETLRDRVGEISGTGSAEYATELNNLALAVKAQGRFAEAEALYHQAVEIDRATIGEAHPNYAIHLNNLAGVVEAQGRLAEAEALCEQALEIGRATIGEAHPSYAIRLNNLALVVEAQGRLTDAEALYKQALEIDRATIGKAHPQYANHLNNLAGVLVKLEKPEEARLLFEQALAIFQNALPPDHPHIAGVKNHLANLPNP